MTKLCALLRIQLFSQQDDTKIVNFDEGVLILWPFFWGNVILKICHFWDVPQISIVWLPGKVSALALKNEDSIHYVTLQFAVLQSRGATQQNSSRPQSWLLIEKKQILKMTLPQKNGSRIKTPSSKLLILKSFCWKENIYCSSLLRNFLKSVHKDGDHTQDHDSNWKKFKSCHWQG